MPFAIKAASQDWHPKDHASFASNHPGPENEPFTHKATMTNPCNPTETKQSTLWPSHCIQDTPGAAISPEINANRLEKIVHKGMDSRVEMYSAFNDIFGNKLGYSSDLAEALREVGVTHLYLCGLTGDCCVFESALGARREGFEVIVLEDLTRSVSDESYQAAVREMKAVGIVVTNSSQAEVARVQNLRQPSWT
jgi:nicotinamidase-related amidase